jgi:hypothetical protein
MKPVACWQAQEIATLFIMPSRPWSTLCSPSRNPEGLHFSRSQQHQLDSMIRGLSPENPFKSELNGLSWLEAYATTFRYPCTKGGILLQNLVLIRLSLKQPIFSHVFPNILVST